MLVGGMGVVIAHSAVGSLCVGMTWQIPQARVSSLDKV